MAELIVNLSQIKQNIHNLSEYLQENGIYWSLIVKVLSGNKRILKEILNDPIVEELHSVGDSRLSSLQNVKEINPNITTMYIKPPAIRFIPKVIKYADISLNTSYKTILALDEEAKKQDKIHKVIIMVELGELREGVMRENLVNFYNNVFALKNIEVVGLGTNLGCMFGIMPTYDKMIQLGLYKQLIEAKFSEKLSLVSGGSSITLPLISMKKLPQAINHFRIGETAFFGVSPLDGEIFDNLSDDTFMFSANIIELEQKESEPDGILSEGNVGHTSDDVSNSDLMKLKESDKNFRAIVDFGLLDVDAENLKPIDDKIEFAGTTSDMTVYSIEKNRTENGLKYHIGDKICFKPDYMSVARLLNSRFIEIKIK